MPSKQRERDIYGVILHAAELDASRQMRLEPRYFRHLCCTVVSESMGFFQIGKRILWLFTSVQ